MHEPDDSGPIQSLDISESQKFTSQFTIVPRNKKKENNYCSTETKLLTPEPVHQSICVKCGFLYYYYIILHVLYTSLRYYFRLFPFFNASIIIHSISLFFFYFYFIFCIIFSYIAPYLLTAIIKNNNIIQCFSVLFCSAFK